jgi:hypothetical protein
MRQCLNLKHPNLLSLYDIRQDGSGDTWVVMEYMSGKCLETELADHPQGLPPQEALVWFHGIAAGVAYLHDHGIVHRDLKPGNIFCDEGLVKVGDYGLSKFISCSRRSGHTESIGTVHYMAPEVAHGRYGKELDIYALGAILYELLTGRVPFDGESVGEVLMKHLTAQPDVSKLAEPYRSVVARALEKDPARRFATVGEMAAALPAATVAPVGPPEAHAARTSTSHTSPESHTSHPLATTLPPGGHDGGQRMAEKPAVGWTSESAQSSRTDSEVHPTAAEIICDASSDQEPIAQFVTQQWRRLRHRWQRSTLHPGAKRLIVAGCILFLVLTPGIWLPGGAFLLILYGGYRLVRFFYRLCFRAAPVALPVARRFRPPAASEIVRPALVIKPLALRASELIGSLLVAAAVTAAMCVVMLLVEAHRGMTLQIEQCAWLYLVSLAGAWLVLAAAKVWEGSRGERMLRHFMLMIAGLGLGLTAFGVAEALLVRLPGDDDPRPNPSAGQKVRAFDGGNELLVFEPPGYLKQRVRASEGGNEGADAVNAVTPRFPNPFTTHWVPAAFYQDARLPAMAYMAAFATLMAVLRWWLDADPMRSTRLSLWSVLVTVFFAHIIATAWQFPQPWLVMVAASMSVAVQLSSPWVPPYARLRPQRKKVV